jgi:DNA invertase Pin-like site-specific DNA recombinase
MVLDGYIRVSQVAGREGESFISPDVQRDEIEGWVAHHGPRLGEVFEELNQSGGRDDRPKLMRAIERVECGESNGLIVAKLDRFGRSLLDGLRAIQRIEEAGGTFVSVQDGLDLTTPTGKLVLQILLSISEWELARIKANWEVAIERAIARGVYTSQVPIGYRRGPGGRLQVDPGRGAIVREIFAQRISGKSRREIAEGLNELGLKTATGGPFNDGGIAVILANPAYRGEARKRKYRNPAAHQPLVDPATWQKCQVLDRAPRRRLESLLAGIIRCGSCGRMMAAQRPSGVAMVRFNVYRCGSEKGQCSAPAHARGEELDPLIEEFVFKHCRIAARKGDAAALRRCEQAVAAAEAELAAYRDEPLVLSTIGVESFAAGLACRHQLLEERQLELTQARRAATPARIDLEALEKSWPALSWDERREALRDVIDLVVVEPGRGELLGRCWVFRHGRAPAMMEGSHLVGRLDPASQGGERLQAHRRLPRGRLAGQLQEFFAERREWPPYLEFAKAGCGRLHAQALLWGGPYFWGPRLGVRVPGETVRWSEPVIRGALAPFLEGRRYWPQRADFEQAGLLALYHAMRDHHGLDHWARRFGFAYRRAHKFVWTDGQIEYELGRLSNGSGELPTRTQMREAGFNTLYEAVKREGGLAYWAERLGLSLSARRLAAAG